MMPRRMRREKGAAVVQERRLRREREGELGWR
jgi:hypothetical protein